MRLAFWAKGEGVFALLLLGRPDGKTKEEKYSPLEGHFRPIREGMSQRPSGLCEG